MRALRMSVALGSLLACASPKGTPKLVELPGDRPPPESDIEVAFPPAPSPPFDAGEPVMLAADAAIEIDGVPADGPPAQASCGTLTEGGTVLPSPLRATLRVPERVRSFSTHQLTVEGTVTLSNAGAEPARWYGRYVAVALEMKDAAGRRVPPCPPPVPVPDDGVTGWNTLLPGADASFSAVADVCHGVTPGHYLVRFAGVPGDMAHCDVKSAWMPVDVAAAR